MIFFRRKKCLEACIRLALEHFIETDVMLHIRVTPSNIPEVYLWYYPGIDRDNQQACTKLTTYDHPQTFN
jgi:hypothetical protein